MQTYFGNRDREKGTFHGTWIGGSGKENLSLQNRLGEFVSNKHYLLTLK